jgi:hypothetical protein
VNVDWVALAGIASGVVVSYMGLRSQRRLARDERLADRRALVYEEFLAYTATATRHRHEQMHNPVKPVDPYESDPAEMVPMLNRVLMYASRPVLDALRDADRADRLWREACVAWQFADSEEAISDEELDARRTEAVICWQAAEVAAERVMESIRREILSGKPTRLRLGRRFRREVHERTFDVLITDAQSRTQEGARHHGTGEDGRS